MVSLNKTKYLNLDSLSIKKLPFLLIILFIIQGAIFSGMYPLWEGVDEPAHFAYVQQIAEKKTLPTPGDEPANKEDIRKIIEKKTPSIYMDKISNEVIFSFDKVPVNILLTPPGKIVQDFWNNYTINEILDNKNSLSEISFLERTNPSEWPNWETKQPPLAYITQVPVYFLMYDQDIFDRTFTLRIFSVLVTAIAILFAFKTISLIFNDNFMRMGSLMFIVFNPMFTTNITRVNNEFLTILFFSIFLYLIVRYLKGKTNLTHIILIGLVLGLGLLSKQTFLVAILLVPIFIIFKNLQNKNEPKRTKLVNSVKHTVIIFGITIPIVSWWYIAVFASGNFSGIPEIRNLTIGEYLQGAIEVNWFTFSQLFFKGFWGTYGWSINWAPFPYYEITAILIGISIGGLGYGIFRTSKKIGFKLIRNWKYQSIFILSLSILFLIAAQVIVSIQIHFVLDSFKSGLWFGWYLFITITAISLFVFLGYRTLIINSKLKKFQNESLLASFLILLAYNITTFYWLVPKYYLGA